MRAAFLFCSAKFLRSLCQRVATRPRTTVLSISIVSPVNWSAQAWAERGERGAGGTSAIMAESCSVVMGKAGVATQVGPSLGDSIDMDEWAGEADML